MSLTLRSSRPTARKAHRCDLCSSVIQPGETYDRQTNVYDGRLYDWLTCHPCIPLGSLLADWVIDYTEGFGQDEAYEWASEHIDHPQHGEAARAYLARRGIEVSA